MKPTDPAPSAQPTESALPILPHASSQRPYRPLGAAKVQPCHLDRLAIVYIRQSTPQQVLEHRESAARQYALADYAVALGWPTERVLVIDEDQGQSARSTEARPGFQHLLGEVTLDHVGIVLGLEMSRLARSSKDCQQLIEVCGIFRTLLADQDGVYDANDPNDRLLLGLKGTISEVELHTLRSRLERGRLNKALRGELFHSAPRGYIRGPSGQIEFDPDEQVQAVVRLIFDKFDELGTAHAVFQYLLRHDIRVGGRLRCGPRKGQLHWRPASLSTIFNILHHPFYAGIYAHGRKRIDPKRKRLGHPGSGRVIVPPAEWKVRLPDRIPAYISEERFWANQERLRQNQSRSTTPGTPRSGGCLLSGLIRCGQCGGRMQARYPQAEQPTYACGRQYRQGISPNCPGLRAALVDELVAEHVLLALEPASLQLSLQALADVEKERRRLNRHWEQQLERARYETQDAERRYQLVDPANRLVARTLEQRWEQALLAQRRLEEEYDRFARQQPPEVTEAERQRLLRLALDIPALWRDSQTTAQQRKEVIRCLVEQVVVTVAGRSEQLSVAIHWAGGFISEHSVRRSVSKYELLSNYEELKERILCLREAGHSAAEIAAQLNAEGWLMPRGRGQFTKDRVLQWLSHRRLHGKPPAAAQLGKHECRLPELAAKLGMKLKTLQTWRLAGWLGARWVAAGRYWIAWVDGDELRRLRRLLRFSRDNPKMAFPEELRTPKQRKQT